MYFTDIVVLPIPVKCFKEIFPQGKTSLNATILDTTLQRK